MIAVFLAVSIGFSILPIINSFKPEKGNKDYSLWYQTGREVLRGESVYALKNKAGEFEYLYPPFPAIFFLAPLAAMGYPAMVVSLVAINSAAWGFSILASVRLVKGRAGGQGPLLYLLPGASTVAYVWDTYFLGQSNIVLLATMLAAFLALRARRPWVAGGLIGLATAVKAFPILALPYLIYRRYWMAAAAAVVGTVFFLAIAPAPIRGFERNLDELKIWTRGMVLNQSGDTIAQRSTAYTYRNQSVLSLAHRLLRPIEAGTIERVVDGQKREIPFWSNFASLSAGAAYAVFAFVAVAAGAWYLWCMGLGRAPSVRAEALEVSILLGLIVLFSPLAWTYFFCWLMPGFACAAAFICESPRGSGRRRAAAAAVAVCLVLLALAAVQGTYPMFQGWGATAWGAALLLGLLGWMLRLERRRMAALAAGPSGLASTAV